MREGIRALLKFVFGVLLAALLSAPAAAQESGVSCARIEDDAERLACYDSLFRTEAPLAEGSETVTIASERLIPAFPTGREPAEMIVACSEGQLTVQFQFAGQILSTGDIAPITFQVDQNATAVRTLRASPDNTAVGFWTTPESNAFLSSLVGGTNLKVRMTPVRQRSLTVDFRLAAHRDAIEAVRLACN